MIELIPALYAANKVKTKFYTNSIETKVIEKDYNKDTNNRTFVAFIIIIVILFISFVFIGMAISNVVFVLRCKKDFIHGLCGWFFPFLYYGYRQMSGIDRSCRMLDKSDTTK